MTVANKRIRVSSDDVTYYTLPGNSGSLSHDGAVVDDTVFGQAWKSEFPTLLNSQIQSPAFYKGFAGYQCDIKKSGTPTTMTGEAMSLVTGKIYRITDAAKRIIDPATAVVVLDNAVDHTADVISIDFLDGTIEFAGAYTVTGPVTITGKYLPMTLITKGNNFTLTMTAEATETSDFETMQANGGIRTFQQGLRTVNLEVKGFYDSANAYLALTQARGLLAIEIAPIGSTTAGSFARGFFRASSDNQAGNVGAIEDETIKFNLSVPDFLTELALYPFRWYHEASTLSTAVQKVLDAYQDGTGIHVQYLPDGTNGVQFDNSVMTSVSLTGGVDGINTFSCTFQNSGGSTAVP